MRVVTSRLLVREYAFAAQRKTLLVSGRCSQPVTIDMEGRPDQIMSGLGREPSSKVFCTMEVRCRKCPNCLRERASSWARRALNETALAQRTWFGTLTLSPHAHFLAMGRAERKLRNGGEVFEDLTAEEQFRYRHAEISKEITLWLKRVRKESEADLRYCLTVEAHKSGLPHYHLLLHENLSSRPVLHRTLGSQWRLGYSSFKLADRRSAFYVTKYLSKDARARVRASQRYGDADYVTALHSKEGKGLDPEEGKRKNSTFFERTLTDD